MEMPPLNRRILELRECKADSVSAFVNILNEGKSEGIISQQKMDRIFHVDNKTGKYPSVSLDIIEAIIIRFPEVDAYWLVTGIKKSDITVMPDEKVTTLLTDEIEKMRISLEKLSKVAAMIVGSDKPKDHPAKADLSLDKKSRSVKPKGNQKSNLSEMGK